MDGKKTNLEAHHEAHQNNAAEMLQKTLENLVEALSSKKDNDKTNACIDVHQKALDDLVNVNSLFTIAVFVLLNIRKKELTRDHQTKNHRYVPDRLCKKILLSEPWERFSLALAVLSSFAGIVLLTLSIVYVIQIRVGKLTCGSDHAFLAVAPLCVIVFTALLFYVPSMAYAVIVSASATASAINENAEDIKGSNGSETPKLASADVISRCFGSQV
ncbi:hypothetical protein Dsin_014499 [Dipteronia sinensis]|uniref:Uncharacterized protein n=1 Tax=Dipteronia sinensis TaxID=43782 RepID=A0AAE0AN83_9ROSI|nr:hypothetical protein Dsin_014499 [Dipteronia sinensis]